MKAERMNQNGMIVQSRKRRLLAVGAERSEDGMEVVMQRVT